MQDPSVTPNHLGMGAQMPTFEGTSCSANTWADYSSAMTSDSASSKFGSDSGAGLHQTWMIMEYCDKGSLQVRAVPAGNYVLCFEHSAL